MTAVERRRRDEPVRVAVVGVGQMGANHARVYAGLKGADLVAVVDHDLEVAAEVATRHDCLALTSIDDLPPLDAATVSVPSALHAAVACPLLERGVACLVEKPLAATDEDCRAILAAAGDTPLLVGHIERFNPAVTQLREILRDGHQVLAVEARRMSAVSGRITDVDVVSDLMVHDLDIVVDLVGTPVVDVVARGVVRDGVAGDDYATAVLGFDGGAMAVLTASRITQNQVRELQVTTDQRFFTVDYPNQELRIHRQGRIGGIGDRPVDAGTYVLDVSTERVFVRRTEPLVAELTHFLEVVRGRAEPLVTGAQGHAALELVWRVRDQIAGSGARRG